MGEALVVLVGVVMTDQASCVEEIADIEQNRLASSSRRLPPLTSEMICAGAVALEHWNVIAPTYEMIVSEVYNAIALAYSAQESS